MMQVEAEELEQELARRAMSRAPPAGVEYVRATGVRGLREAGVLNPSTCVNPGFRPAGFRNLARQEHLKIALRTVFCTYSNPLALLFYKAATQNDTRHANMPIWHSQWQTPLNT